ncbi:13474_t:CDS:1, partial [Cetraspora pellucida]
MPKNPSPKSLSSISRRKEDNRKHNAGRKPAKDDAYVQQTDLKKYYNRIQQRKYQKQQKSYISSLEKEVKELREVLEKYKDINEDNIIKESEDFEEK